MLRSSHHLRSLLRYSQTAAAAQLQQQRFLNVHEYQVSMILQGVLGLVLAILPYPGTAAASTAAHTLALDTAVHLSAAERCNSVIRHVHPFQSHPDMH